MPPTHVRCRDERSRSLGSNGAPGPGTHSVPRPPLRPRPGRQPGRRDISAVRRRGPPDGLHQLQSNDPHNIVRLILPQAATPEARNEQAAGTLRRWLSEGVLTADPEPGLYVYEQRDGTGMLQRGLIGALRVTDPAERVVLPTRT